MTTAEAKQKIKEEFVRRYYEWLKDEIELSDNDYGRKYGWYKSANGPHKDTLKSVNVFQKYIFSGATQERWEAMGIDRKAIWALRSEGWLSCQEGHYRRATFYYLSQQRAKEIYKEAKTA